MNLYYVYKDKYNEEKEGLNIKTKRYFYYKKLRLTDDYQYESEEEEAKRTQTSEKEPPKKPTKDNVSNHSQWVYRKETGINIEIFHKHFSSFQRPSAMLKSLYKTNDK